MYLIAENTSSSNLILKLCLMMSSLVDIKQLEQTNKLCVRFETVSKMKTDIGNCDTFYRFIKILKTKT